MRWIQNHWLSHVSRPTCIPISTRATFLGATSCYTTQQFPFYITTQIYKFKRLHAAMSFHSNTHYFQIIICANKITAKILLIHLTCSKECRAIHRTTNVLMLRLYAGTYFVCRIFMISELNGNCLLYKSEMVTIYYTQK